MTDKEIVQALRCCRLGKPCTSCPVAGTGRKLCFDEVHAAAVAAIERLTAENAALRENVPQWISVEADHLRELAEADKAGRCVVLPCKVGDTVWFTRSVFRQAAEPIEAVVLCAANHGGAGLTYTTRTVNGGLQRKFTSGQIGKTVFLTREEAERAMEGKKNGNKTSL